LIKPALFRQIADAVLQRSSHRLAEQLDAAGIGHGDIHDHPDGRGLTGAVWADQSKDASGADLQAEIRDCGEVTITLGDVVHHQRGCCEFHTRAFYVISVITVSQRVDKRGSIKWFSLEGLTRGS